MVDWPIARAISIWGTIGQGCTGSPWFAAITIYHFLWMILFWLQGQILEKISFVANVDPQESPVSFTVISDSIRLRSWLYGWPWGSSWMRIIERIERQTRAHIRYHAHENASISIQQTRIKRQPWQKNLWREFSVAFGNDQMISSSLKALLCSSNWWFFQPFFGLMRMITGSQTKSTTVVAAKILASLLQNSEEIKEGGGVVASFF